MPSQYRRRLRLPGDPFDERAEARGETVEICAVVRFERGGSWSSEDRRIVRLGLPAPGLNASLEGGDEIPDVTEGDCRSRCCGM